MEGRETHISFLLGLKAPKTAPQKSHHGKKGIKKQPLVFVEFFFSFGRMIHILK